MNNKTQIERYKKLITYLQKNFKEDIDIKKVEDICHYSYRNINRIFEAIQGETIGKYIKRLRIEKAAQYLKYSEMPIADIAYEVGFEDRAVFSKTFKKRFNCSPSQFRKSEEILLKTQQESIGKVDSKQDTILEYEIVYLPDFYYLFLEYRGSYEDITTIEKKGNELFEYVYQNNSINNKTLFVTEIVDDSDISDSIHLRFNLGLTLEKPITFTPENLFRFKKHKRQKYVKFVHSGSHQSCTEFYNTIYALWMSQVNLELKDLPTLECYPNYLTESTQDDVITEIYIPVL